MKKIPIIVASFFGIGFLKPFSATWGSLVATVLLYFFWPFTPIVVKIIVMILMLFIGVLCSEKIVRAGAFHDPHFIVIDEVLGMMISTFLLPPLWRQWVCAFFLFRFFDILKPWPISIIDRKQGGFAIIFDDIVAGFFVLSLFLLYTFLS